MLQYDQPPQAAVEEPAPAIQYEEPPQLMQQQPVVYAQSAASRIPRRCEALTSHCDHQPVFACDYQPVFAVITSLFLPVITPACFCL